MLKDEQGQTGSPERNPVNQRVKKTTVLDLQSRFTKRVGGPGGDAAPAPPDPGRASRDSLFNS